MHRRTIPVLVLMVFVLGSLLAGLAPAQARQAATPHVLRFYMGDGFPDMLEPQQTESGTVDIDLPQLRGADPLRRRIERRPRRGRVVAVQRRRHADHVSPARQPDLQRRLAACSPSASATPCCASAILTSTRSTSTISPKSSAAPSSTRSNWPRTARRVDAAAYDGGAGQFRGARRRCAHAGDQFRASGPLLPGARRPQRQLHADQAGVARGVGPGAVARPGGLGRQRPLPGDSDRAGGIAAAHPLRPERALLGRQGQAGRRRVRRPPLR